VSFQNSQKKLSQSCQARETTGKNRHEIQIDTKLFRPQAPMAIGFTSNQNRVRRTVVCAYLLVAVVKKCGLP
jgi:hypothetical protein